MISSRAPPTGSPHPAAISDLEEELSGYLLQAGRLRLQSNPRPKADERSGDGEPPAKKRREGYRPAGTCINRPPCSSFTVPGRGTSGAEESNRTGSNSGCLWSRGLGGDGTARLNILLRCDALLCPGRITPTFAALEVTLV